MQGQVQFYSVVTELALKPSYMSWRSVLEDLSSDYFLIFLFLSNGEVILSVSHSTISCVGWKTRVQLEVDLAFHCMSREKISHAILSFFAFLCGFF